MSKKIIGVTVGTTLSPAKIQDKLKPIKTVNGVAPDENGDVKVSSSKISIIQTPQLGGRYDFEQGKVYKVYAPNADGRFNCRIVFTVVGELSPRAIHINPPCENEAESFEFEVISSEYTFDYGRQSECLIVTYRIDETINTVRYEVDSAEAEAYVYTGTEYGVTKVGILTDEIFINPDAEDGEDGEDGATFTPSVSDDGVMSWTNDKGLENPPSVNLVDLVLNSMEQAEDWAL